MKYMVVYISGNNFVFLYISRRKRYYIFNLREILKGYVLWFMILLIYLIICLVFDYEIMCYCENVLFFFVYKKSEVFKRNFVKLYVEGIVGWKCKISWELS